MVSGYGKPCVVYGTVMVCKILCQSGCSLQLLLLDLSVVYIFLSLSGSRVLIEEFDVFLSIIPLLVFSFLVVLCLMIFVLNSALESPNVYYCQKDVTFTDVVASNTQPRFMLNFCLVAYHDLSPIPFRQD